MRSSAVGSAPRGARSDLEAEPGEPPYPERDERGAIAEIEALDPDAVVVKGDLTERRNRRGVPGVPRRVHAARPAHAPRARQPRRDDHRHDCGDRARSRSISRRDARGDRHRSPGHRARSIPSGQLEWLEDLRRSRQRRCSCSVTITRGIRARRERNEHYFGINPDDSEALCGVITRCESVAGYFAGHTHRNRVRHFDAARPSRSSKLRA